MQGGIERLRAEVERRGLRHQVHHHVRIGIDELRQTRHEPIGSKGGQNSEIESSTCRVRPQVHRRGPYVLQAFSHLPSVGVTCGSESNRLPFAPEQRNFELLLQHLYLSTHSALREIQLQSGGSHAAGARSRFECRKCCQRRQEPSRYLHSDLIPTLNNVLPNDSYLWVGALSYY